MKQPSGHKFHNFSKFWWSDRGLSAFLLTILVLMFLESFIHSPLLPFIFELFFAMLLISGINVISTNHAIRLTAAVVIVTTVGIRWTLQVMSSPSLALQITAMTLSLFSMATLTLVTMIHAFRTDSSITSDRVRGAIAAYLLVGITWTLIYQLIELCHPLAFSMAIPGLATDSHQDSFAYFSFVTLTTLGYGDITPIDPLARTAAILEALIGQLYPATLLARLVSLEIAGRQIRPPKEDR